MAWQDLVLSLGTVIFIIALIPAVLHKEKPPITTSFLNAGVLATFVVVYISIEFWYAAIANVFTSTLWFVIGIQKLRQKPTS